MPNNRFQRLSFVRRLCPWRCLLFVIVAFAISLGSHASAQAPATPTGVYAYVSGSTTVINWNSVSGATSFNVYRGTSPGGESATPIKTGQASSPWTDGGVTANTTYYYQVTAVNASGESSKSLEVSATPPIARLPAPTVWGTSTSTTVTLNWTAVSGATSYMIARQINGGTLIYGYAQGITGTTFTDTGLTSGTNYSYRVYGSCVNGLGVGAPSSTTITPGTTLPTAPTGVYAAVSGSSVILGWNAVSGASSYNIYRGTSSGGESATPVALGVSGPTWTDSSVVANTTYYYKMTALNSGGEGPQSLEVSATPPIARLPAPTVWGTSTSTTVTLNWTAVSGATSYMIARQINGGTLIYGYAQGITGTTFTDTGLTSGTNYSYRVYGVCVNGLGNGAPSSTTITPGTTLPTAPTGVYAYVSGSTNVINWATVAGATSYNVYRGTTPGGEAAVPVTFGVSSSPWTDGSVTANTTYYYKVTAVNAGGEGPLSPEASATAPVTRLIAPTVWISTSTSTTATVNWSSVSGATSYMIAKQVGSGTIVYCYQQGLTGNSFTDTGLTSGTSYTYRVYGVSVNGTGFGGQASVTPGTALPSAATGLRIQPGSTTLNLYWNPTPGATSYDIYRGTSPGGEGAVPISTSGAYSPDPSEYEFNDGGLTNGTTYYYFVKGVSAGGEGGASNEAAGTPGGTVIAAPTGIAGSVTGNTVNLSWNPVTGASSYNVYRQDNSGNWLVLLTGVTRSSIADRNLVSGLYAYRVAAISSVGSSTSSATVSTQWTLAASPASLTIARGSSAGISISGNPTGGMTQTITTGVTGLPAGVTGAYYPSGGVLSLLPAGAAGTNPLSPSTTVLLCVSATATPGTYSLTISGANGIATSTVPVTLTIN